MKGVKIHAKQAVMVDARVLVPHRDNPRRGDIGAIITSIKQNGFYGALVVQEGTNHILAGNHRFLAGLDAGMTEFPVMYVQCSNLQAKKILVADNKASALGSDDYDQLSQLLIQIQSEDDLFGTLYDGDDLDELLRSLNGTPGGGAPPPTGEDETGKLKSVCQVLVNCNSEAEQAELLERLTDEGYECRALIS